MDDSAEEIPTATRRFSVLETTSGLPEDSREEDERRAERGLRDLRGRVKAARAVASTPGLAGLLKADWRKAALFYARFGITEARFRLRAPVDEAGVGEDLLDQVRAPCDEYEEVRTRAALTLPGSNEWS